MNDIVNIIFAFCNTMIIIRIIELDEYMQVRAIVKVKEEAKYSDMITLKEVNW